MKKLSSRLLGATIAAGAAAAIALVGTTPAMAAGTVTVTPDQLGDYAQGTSTSWVVETDGGTGNGIVTIEDGAVTLERPARTDNAALLLSFGTDASRSTDLAALAGGTSYSYSGSTVNFQFRLFYQPLSGGDPCVASNNSDLADAANTCFTTLKYQPYQDTTPGTETTIDLNGKTNASAGGTLTGGWETTQALGSFAKGASLSLGDALAQMASYEVFAVGVSTGSGQDAGTSEVSGITVGGTSYAFAAAPTGGPVDPADMPQSTDALLAAATPIAPSSVTTDAELNKVDAAEGLSGSIAWTAPDTDVDVFLYSSPTKIGTATVAGGKVSFALTAAQLKGLTGTHHLAFVGQTSGALSSLAFTLAAAPAGGTGDELAETGATTGMAPLIGSAALALLAGGGVLVLARRRLARAS